MSVIFVTAIVGMLASWVGMGVLFGRLRPHRIDISPREPMGRGRSAFWQVNVLRPENYAPPGKRLLRWFWLFQAMWLGSAFLFMILLMWNDL